MSMTFKDILEEMVGGKYSESVAKGIMNTMESKMKPNANVKGVMDTDAETSIPTAIDVMRGEDTYDYDFEVDGNTEGFTFSSDGNISLEDIQRMRDMQGITADGQMKPNTDNLGLGASATHTMPDGTVMPGATHNANAQSEMGGMSMAAGQGGVDRATFNANFANLTDAQKASVAEMMAGMTPAQKEMFARGMTTSGKLGGYEVGEQNRLAY